MIDTVFHLLFRCAHRHLTRPFTPVAEEGVAHRETYVVCLDCARQFAYDLHQMRVGTVIDHPHDACVLPPGTPGPRNIKLAWLGLAVPVAVLVGAVLEGKEARRRKEPGTVNNCEEANSALAAVLLGRATNGSGKRVGSIARRT